MTAILKALTDLFLKPVKNLVGKVGQDDISGQRLTLPLVLEDGRVPGLFRNTIYVTAVCLLLAMVWVSVGQIRELAVANGRIIPAGSIRLVHHLEGGQVFEVAVRQGELVDKGDPILHLQPVAAKSDLGQLKLREANLQLQIVRLDALITGTLPKFGALAVRFPKQSAIQMQLFRSQMALRNNELMMFDSQILSRKIEARALGEEAKVLVRRAEILYGEVETYAALLKKKLATRRTYLSARSSHKKALAESISVNGRYVTAQEKVIEAKKQKTSWQAKSLQGFAEERSKLVGELAELRQRIAKHSDRVERLVVRAPVRGVVQKLYNPTPGEVIKPGGIVAKIVPVDVKVFAEVQLDPRDVGHVKVGDISEIRVSTYDPNVFGMVKGKVAKISPTTVQPEKGKPFYRVLLAMDKNYVGRQKQHHIITPGMEVQANIVTGAKSFLHYVLKPVNNSLDLAFAER